MRESQAAPEELVARIHAGDHLAEADLVIRYSRTVMALLRRRTADIQHAEDVHQETFCIVIQRLRSESIDKPAQISAFIHRTAINILIGAYRKDARRQTYADTELIERHVDSRSNQLRALIRAESDQAVRTLIDELPTERDRELLRRFYVLQEEKPLVCSALHITAQHFDRVISRARKRFRQLIERRKLDIAIDGAED